MEIIIFRTEELARKKRVPEVEDMYELMWSYHTGLTEREQIAFGDDLMSRMEDIMCFMENSEYT